MSSQDRLSDSRLEEALSAVLAGEARLIDRSTSRYVSTHHMERVSVQTGSGRLQLVCKYGSSYVDEITGHLRGATYEAAVYRHLFPDEHLATPRCHGSFTLNDSAECLVLEYVDGYRVHHSVYLQGLVGVCRDLARFHARGSRLLPPEHNVFDRPHLSRIAGRMTTLRGIPSRLEASLSMVVEVLSETPRTIIHGEMYPQNVIVNDDGPVVIDWESAGVGPGVLDLAVLTQGSWDADLVAECEEVYWQHAGHLDIDVGRRSLAAARVFAAGQLLVHLERKDTDGVQEEIALDTIGIQLEALEASQPGA